MTLATLLAHFVDWRVRERGRSYFQTGKVRLVASGPEAVEAVVSGSEEYGVTLTREDARVWVFCSCPFFQGGEPCKHVWAAILAADAQKALRGLAGDLPRTLLLPSAAQDLVRPMQAQTGETPSAVSPPAPPPPPLPPRSQRTGRSSTCWISPPPSRAGSSRCA